MNVNPLKNIWDAGNVAIGTYFMYSRDIAAMEVAAAAGLDFVVFDMEHRLQDSETIHDLSQVARLAGVAPLVGPSEISHHAISHVLDLGASGVIIPHVETPEDVALSIEAVHYPPKGKRGRCGVAGHNLYSGRPNVEEIEHYNSDVALLLKVETEAALRSLEDLVDADGVAGIMIGPLDLSINMGIPGQTGHERILELVEHARAVCRKRKIQFGDYVASPDQVANAISTGAGWVIVGSELDILSGTWKRAKQEAEKS